MDVILIECVVKGHHECGFTITAGETFSTLGYTCNLFLSLMSELAVFVSWYVQSSILLLVTLSVPRANKFKFSLNSFLFIAKRAYPLFSRFFAENKTKQKNR